MSAAAQPVAELTDAEILAQFCDAARARDIELPGSIIADGRLHRCDAAGRGGRGDAAYLLHLDRFPAGGLQNHRDGLGWQTWRADIGRQPTPVEYEDLRRKAAADRLEREADDAKRKADAAARAASIWAASEACGDHAYLDRKGVKAHGLRIARGNLVIPLRDAGGTLHSLQFVSADGAKKFLFGGRVRGCLHMIGDPGAVICIAEGFATAASLFEATGHAVAAAFDCGNIKAVAEALRAKYPQALLIVCADDDHLAVGNPGVTKAREAAVTVGGTVAIPSFGTARPERANDFNDMADLMGKEAVERCISIAIANRGTETAWPPPDPSLLNSEGVAPPALPAVLPGGWGEWAAAAADAAGCPVDYVAMPLLAAAGVLIGNSRWAQPWAGWREPPALFVGLVGRPSSGKSPGLDMVSSRLAEMEVNLNDDWDDRRRGHKRDVVAAKERRTGWEADLQTAIKLGAPVPDMPVDAEEPDAPQRRRLFSTDPTIEKAARLSHGNSHGLILLRDELAGWIGSMDRYSRGEGGDRAFWLQAYGGRPWSPDRVKDGDRDTSIPHLLWSVCGGIQPDRVASQLLAGDDDGLAARHLFTWPRALPPRRPHRLPDNDAADRALRRLYDMPWPGPQPIVLPFTKEGADILQALREEVAVLEDGAAGMFLSWLGKLPGFCVRLSLILQHLEWCWEGHGQPPEAVGHAAVAAAADFLETYAVPMARRVFGEAALPQVEGDARTLARWFARQDPTPELVNAKALRRMANGPGIPDADRMVAALSELADAGWLRASPARASGYGRPRGDWSVNPTIRGLRP